MVHENPTCGKSTEDRSFSVSGSGYVFLMICRFCSCCACLQTAWQALGVLRTALLLRTIKPIMLCHTGTVQRHRELQEHWNLQLP